MNLVDELQKLVEMKTSGAITEAEFAQAKAVLFNQLETPALTPEAVEGIEPSATWKSSPLAWLGIVIVVLEIIGALCWLAGSDAGASLFMGVIPISIAILYFLTSGEQVQPEEETPYKSWDDKDESESWFSYPDQYDDAYDEPHDNTGNYGIRNYR